MFLNCKTWFSFHYGTFPTKDLVESAQSLGIKAMALTNINSTADCWDFVLKCQEANIKPIVGVEIRNENELCYILLAKNNAGLYVIQSFLSFYKQRKLDFPKKPPFESDDLWVIYTFENHPEIEQLRPNELIGLRKEDLNKLSWQEALQADCWVVLQPVTYQDKTYYDLHRILRAIAKNTLLSKLVKEDYARPNETLMDEESLVSAYAKFPSVISKTMEVVKSCSIEMTFHIDKNKKHFTASMDDDHELLRKLAIEGCKIRYGSKNKKAMERVEKELSIIKQSEFNSYFLIVWDMLRYANEQGFYHVGRGSGANSVVAY